MRRHKLTCRWALCGALLFLWAVTGGCDSTASLFIAEVKWDELRVLSAVPMKKVSDTDGVRYEPQCRLEDDGADGLLFRVLFKGTQQRAEDGGEADLDQSIRPGDRIDLQQVEEARVTPERFILGLDCIERAQPAELQCQSSDDCDGGEVCYDTLVKGICVDKNDDAAKACSTKIKSDDVNISSIGFKPFTASRAENVGVAILVDMSGSMNGLVHYYPPYHEDSLEEVLLSLPEGADYGKNGSDVGRARLAAVETIIANLNADDEFIVFTYNENNIDVACKLPGQAEADTETKKSECFGSNRSLVLGGEGQLTSALEDIQGDAKGRSPLWSAVDQVYDYMQNHSATQGVDTKHIVVITDGPDTCATSTDLNNCRSTCLQYSTPFSTALSTVEAVEYEDRIPMHFIQFAAKGYPDRDPRQQEIACLTGGHYIFINSLDFSSASLPNVLNDTVRWVRFTFGGYWEFAVEMDKFGTDDTSLPRGWDYAIAGAGKVISLKEDRFLVPAESPFYFSIEDGNTDRRLTVRKDCAVGDDSTCPDDESAGQCGVTTWWCDDQTLTCKSAQKWLENGTGQDSCGKTKAKVIVKIQGGGAPTTQEVSLPDLPTVCCNGACMPPNPPTLPTEITNPVDAEGGCFYFDEVRGWTPDPVDPENGGWVYWGTLYVKQGCPAWNDVKGEIGYGLNGNPAVADLTWPDDWTCPDSANCFPPAGEE